MIRYVHNPPNPWLSTDIEWIGEPPESKLEIFEETATRSIITHNNSPDVGFEYSVNCYRGCTHACTYCFARPYHEYLGFGAGTDFERKIIAKVRAPELLRKELLKPSWQGSELAFSFTSDPYIPIEANYQLTRKCLEVCLEFRNPVSIITKSALICRDLELLKSLSKEADLSVWFTLPFLDAETARALEPFAPLPEARIRAMKTLADAGISVGIAIAPVIPGLSESQIPEILTRSYEAGARRAFITMLRLPGSVADYFVERLEADLPLRAGKILKRIREMRDGKLYEGDFGQRMKGKGEYWDMIVKSFRLHCRKLGFNVEHAVAEQRKQTFQRPLSQLSLFD
ncbi:MAG TPA: PA0069 family radical SAM protein [Blastocatellia bacterium]|nr:PA0069 family radical SAM protein [Blastocatellia bacterium]